MKRSTRHEAEMRWLSENEAFLEEHYAGLWVAIKGASLLTTGDSFGDVAVAAENQGIDDAVIAPVKPRELQGVYLIR